MSIKYNIIQKGTPGVEGGGEKKFYASNKVTGQAGIDELTERIEKISTVSGSDIRAVLYGLADVVPSLLKDGLSVNISDLGFFRVSISSDPSDKEEEVNKTNIRGAKILFRPGDKFKEMLQTLKFEKAGS